MRFHGILDSVIKTVKDNAPEILTALGAVGVVSTAYLTAKATFTAADLLSTEPEDMPTKEKVKHVWRLYIPAGVSGVVSVACIVGASHGNHRRTAAAVTAYSLSEKAFVEYKDKVEERIGRAKEQRLRDDIAQDRVTAHPPGSKEVIIIGGGQTLCCELYTHRYFRSDMETLRRAVNNVNHMIISHRYITLDNFYAEVGLPHNDASGDLGWDDEELMDLEFSAVLTEEGEPCLAFKYNYLRPVRT